MDINKYVSQLLSRKELLAQIETPFAKGGYKVNRVSVEKVLLEGFERCPFIRGKCILDGCPMMHWSGSGLEGIDLPHRIGIRMIPALSESQGTDGRSR